MKTYKASLPKGTYVTLAESEYLAKRNIVKIHRNACGRKLTEQFDAVPLIEKEGTDVFLVVVRCGISHLTVHTILTLADSKESAKAKALQLLHHKLHYEAIEIIKVIRTDDTRETTLVASHYA